MIIIDLIFLLIIGLFVYFLLARKAGKIGCYVLRFLGYKLYDYDEEDKR